MKFCAHKLCDMFVVCNAFQSNKMLRFLWTESLLAGDCFYFAVIVEFSILVGGKEHVPISFMVLNAFPLSKAAYIF